MFGQLSLMRHRRRRLFGTAVVGIGVYLLAGCSSINELQRTQEALTTLKEADRQFTIEVTPDGSLPSDSGPKRWINRAIALMPHSAVPYTGSLGEPVIEGILEEHGRYPLLISLLKKAVADPKLKDNPDLLLALADAEERMGPTSAAALTYSEALASINRSMSKAGTTFDPDSSVLLDRARAEYYGGERANALKDFQSIIATNPDNAAEAENDLAYFFALDKTNLAQAKKLAILAVADARKQGDDEIIGIYEDTLAWVDHQQGNDRDALYYEQEAASLTPLIADVQYHLGEISKADGQNLEARIAYSRAIKLNPFFPEARAALQSLPPQSASAAAQLDG